MNGYCGLDCDVCEGRNATRKNDDKLRAEVAAKWSAMYHADIKPEHINCEGCKQDGVKFFFCANLCPLRKCAGARGLDTCADCEDYICDKLDAFIKQAPPVGDALKKIRNNAG